MKSIRRRIVTKKGILVGAALAIGATLFGQGAAHAADTLVYRDWGV